MHAANQQQEHAQASVRDSLGLYSVHNQSHFTNDLTENWGTYDTIGSNDPVRYRRKDFHISNPNIIMSDMDADERSIASLFERLAVSQ